MHTFIKKSISVVLCLVFLATSIVALIPESTVPASAATYVTGDNPVSSSYKGSIYYDNFCRVPLTGDARKDVVAVAMSQIGYQESNSPTDLDGIGTGYNNYTEYNENIKGVNWLGTTFYWCASFVSWSLLQSGATDHNSSNDMVRYNQGDKEYIWREVACGTWAYQLNRFGYFRYSKYHGGSYKPQSGDLIFFSWSGSSDESNADHIGIVVYSDDSYVYTVEGNTSDSAGLEDNGDGVYFKSYSLGYSCIIGYGVLPYATNPEVPNIDYSGANPTCGLYMANSSKDVHASADSDTVIAEMPRYTMFEVTEIASNGRLKATYTASNGSTVTGWILNNSYRVIQITTTETNLDEVIKQAQQTRYCDYSEAALVELRAAYNEALAVQSNSSASAAEEKAVADKLKAAIANTVGSELVVSKGASYTVANNRTDGWADDGVRLTDGSKGYSDGNTYNYSGWDNTDIEIIIDLGSSKPSNIYRIYGAGNESWGVAATQGISVSVSDDKSNWTPVASSSTVVNTGTSGDWTTYTISVTPAVENNSRYVKFGVNKGNLSHVWIDEVEVAHKGKAASGKVYVNGFNTRVTSGQTVIFTPDFGEINVSNANHAYTVNLIATWDNTQNGYVVTSVEHGEGNETPAITLESNQILICAHGWEGSNVTDPVAGSAANKNNLAAAKVGEKLSFTQLDITKKTIGAAATVTVGEGKTDSSVVLGVNLALNKTYTATGIYELDGVVYYPDENGVTLTDGSAASYDASYNHVAYVGFNRGTAEYESVGYASITVDLDKAYWMNKFIARVGTGYNESVGVTTPSSISVFVSEDNKNWTEFKTVETTEDSSVSCAEIVIEDEASVYGRYVQFRFVGNTNWIMIAEVEAYEGEENTENPPVVDPDPTPDPDPVYPIGDVNADTKVDSIDYLLVKRSCFNTYTLSSDEYARANVDKNDKIDSLDYILIKRIVFGTYVAQ